ncbi:MAG: pro-sigmaK processing inhibitor BofA family protein [Bacillota bacterium]
MDWKIAALGAVGLLGLYLIGSALIAPFRLLLRLGVAFVAGGVLIALVNLAGTVFHFHIAMNPVTMLAAGAYPVPGLLLLTLLTIFTV